MSNNDDEDTAPELGMNHPTTVVDAKKEERSKDFDEGYHEVDAVVYVHEDGGYELAGLEYGGDLVRGLDAMELYMAELDSLYDDVFHDDGFGTGDLVWGDVREVLGE